jgi:hypothetical protein
MIEKIYEIEKNFVERPKKFREDIANCELVNNMRGGFLYAYGTYVLSIRVFSYGCHTSFTFVFISHSRKLGFVGDC